MRTLRSLALAAESSVSFEAAEWVKRVELLARASKLVELLERAAMVAFLFANGEGEGEGEGIGEGVVQRLRLVKFFQASLSGGRMPPNGVVGRGGGFAFGTGLEEGTGDEQGLLETGTEMAIEDELLLGVTVSTTVSVTGGATACSVTVGDWAVTVVRRVLGDEVAPSLPSTATTE